MRYDWDLLEKKLRKNLTADRYRHTLGVAYMAATMAAVHGYDPETARLAGYLHDCAKCISDKKKLALCEKNAVSITEFEKCHPVLLHAKAGAVVAEQDYDIHDPEVLSAISWHTTGKPDMSLLEKIIFAADYLEPNRDKAPNLTALRKLAYSDLDECVFRILSDTIAYLSKNPKTMDQTTAAAFEFYQKQVYLNRTESK